MTELDSDRLFYRTLSDDDVTEQYVGWLNDPEVNRYLETRFSVQTLESCREFVAAMNRDPGSHLFGMFEKETGGHIGNMKLGFIKPQYHTGQVSMFIGEKSCWRRGYLTEALRRLTLYGFQELGLERIEAGCYEENVASLKACLKLGYTVEGYHRKNVVVDGRRMGCFWMGILRSEFVG